MNGEQPKQEHRQSPQREQDPMVQFFKGILEPEAFNRVMNLYVLAERGDKRKAALLKALFSYLQTLMTKGYISRKIRDEEVVELLKKLAPQERGGSIKIIRK